MSRGLSLFIKLATATLVVVILSQARAVLMPLAFVLVFSFILGVPMKRLQRVGLPKSLALALVMILCLGALGGSGYVLATQLSDLTTQLTKYNESMRRKVAALQRGGSGPLDRLHKTLERVTAGLERGTDKGLDAEPVRVVATELSPAQRLQETVEPLAEPLANVLLVLVLCVFMLGGHEQLRNRLIHLAGPGNLTLTTRALDEGAQRISRYLLDQTVINATFGVIVAAGLYVIGVPYAALWGGFAALLRFVPYVGAMASMLMPATLAFAVFPGWQEALFTVALILGLDVVTAYAIEPLIIGHRTGVSSIALLVSSLFWTWLWGPLGLVLSTPLTVSLSVLGHHIPQLRFLSVLLGDEAVLGAEITFYQRLLARDEDEANEIARQQCQTLGVPAVMDQIILPSLALAARDRGLKETTAEDLAFLVGAARDIVTSLARRERPEKASESPQPASAVLAVAAHGAESELLLEMLAALVAADSGRPEIVPATTPYAELEARIQALRPSLICVSLLPPEGGAPARQLCRRLKASFPALPILAFRPDALAGDSARGAARLREAGADAVATTLAETKAEIARLLAPARAAA